ncbi:hypothetical protein RhiirA1_480452 [Rhizophagus irregularis]|uniref:Uncharacterized protein n=1 Tax=Rhizophagus irregularis TaxID=588596 RepID=A0A2N0QP99_9GLOM|nr:hypothetical protein RhiirA1_480452 [Rhizophagus irregularis]
MVLIFQSFWYQRLLLEFGRAGSCRFLLFCRLLLGSVLVEPKAADSCCFVACFWVLVKPEAADSCYFDVCFWVLVEPKAADSCYFDTCFWVLVEPEALDSRCFDICFWVLIEPKAVDSCCFDIDVCLEESELADSCAEIYL